MPGIARAGPLQIGFRLQNCPVPEWINSASSVRVGQERTLRLLCYCTTTHALHSINPHAPQINSNNSRIPSFARKSPLPLGDPYSSDASKTFDLLSFTASTCADVPNPRSPSFVKLTDHSASRTRVSSPCRSYKQLAVSRGEGDGSVYGMSHTDHFTCLYASWHCDPFPLNVRRGHPETPESTHLPVPFT